MNFANLAAVSMFTPLNSDPPKCNGAIVDNRWRLDQNLFYQADYGGLLTFFGFDVGRAFSFGVGFVRCCGDVLSARCKPRWNRSAIPGSSTISGSSGG